MKLSIAWIFDYIDADWQRLDIADLVKRFNQTTAEIEGVTRIAIDTRALSLAQVMEIKNDALTVCSQEWGDQYTLPLRSGVQTGQWYLIKKDADQGTVRWATSQDFGGAKEFQLPAIYADDQISSGFWKKQIDTADYSIEIDNKSVTHRPDLWGHYGIAREVAAMYNFPLKDYARLCADLPVKEFQTTVSQAAATPFSVTLDEPAISKRFAYYYLDKIETKPSLISVAARLVKVD